MDKLSALDKIFLLRVEGSEGSAKKLAFQTDNSRSESRTFDTDPTKDGNVKTAGAYEGTHSLSSFMGKNDPFIDELEDLVRNDNPPHLEIWEINRNDIDTSTTLKAQYSTDFLTTYDVSSGSEGNVEVSVDTEVDGKVIRGEVTVTPELLIILQRLTDEQEFVQPVGPGED